MVGALEVITSQGIYSYGEIIINMAAKPKLVIQPREIVVNADIVFIGNIILIPKRSACKHTRSQACFVIKCPHITEQTEYG